MTERIVTAARPRLRLRLLVSKLLLVIGAVIVALLIAEVALRILGFTYFNPYIVDEDVGHSLRPSAEGWWTREGRTYVKINSLGFRDREHSIAKPADTFRIAILGDSFAEAFQVPLEKTFWSVLEERVQACSRTPARVEVLNFGVSGFSTARELILLQRRVWQYSPDIIVLLVTPANDIRDNSMSLSRYRQQQPLPYFVFREGNLVLDNSLVEARNHSLVFRLQKSFAGNALNWLQNHLRVLGLIYTIREANQSSQLSKGKKQNSSDAGVSKEPGLDSEVYLKSASAEWEEAWGITIALLAKMRDEVQMKGAKFLVVTGSSGIQVTPDELTRQEFMNRLGVSNLFYPGERIKSVGQAEGFDVLDLAPSLYEYARTNRVFVQGTRETGGTGHWNETGHRLAGELIAREVCRPKT